MATDGQNDLPGTEEDEPPTGSAETKNEDNKETDDHTGKATCCEHCAVTRETVDDHRNRIEGAEKNIGDIGTALERFNSHFDSMVANKTPEAAEEKPKPAPKVTDSKPSGGHFLAKKWGGKK